MAKAASPERLGGRPTHAEAAALHQRLREAAVKTFLENGYDATTMVAIADVAGITKPTLYARYPDKRAVFLDVIPWRSAGPCRSTPPTPLRTKIARNEAHRFPEFGLSAESLGWASRQQQVMDLFLPGVLTR